jgi:hypothetical protein
LQITNLANSLKYTKATSQTRKRKTVEYKYINQISESIRILWGESAPEALVGILSTLTTEQQIKVLAEKLQQDVREKQEREKNER